MSEGEHQSTSILLPQSVVAVYSRDSQTLQAARSINEDWRFARVRIEVYEGSIVDAVETYKSASSPGLIIVQTEKIEDSLPSQLEELAGNCDEDTAAIVVGPVNDVNLYRRLIDMGVSDYLVAPVEQHALSELIARTLIERLGVSGSRLIAFVGAKGGVGASALAQAAAWASADILEQKTILLDAAGGWSSHSVGLGFEPSTTLADAARAASAQDEDKLKRMILKLSDQLSVLGSGGDSMLELPATPAQMEDLIAMLRTKYPVVIADLSGAPPDLQKAVLMQASRIAVVTTPFLTALRLARTLIQEIRSIRNNYSDDGIELIVNMVGLNKAQEVSAKDLEKALELVPAARLNFAGGVFMKSESEGKKISDSKEGREIIDQSLLPMLRKILGVKAGEADSVAKAGVLDGFLSKIKR